MKGWMQTFQALGGRGTKAQRPHEQRKDPELLESHSGLLDVRSRVCEPAQGGLYVLERVTMMGATSCGEIGHLLRTFLPPAAALSVAL